MHLRLPKSRPKICSSDTVRVWWAPVLTGATATGIITDGYKAALREHGLKAFFGNDASIQPGQLQEVMLHETAVAWMRLRLSKTLPKKPWKGSPEEYRARLKLCA